MLDPLSALSLASAIVQFLDFGVKLVAETSQIYRSTTGTLNENAELEDATEKIDRLNSKILEQNDVGAAEAVSEDESILHELARKSKVIANELLTLLQDLKVKSAGKSRKWESFRKAVAAQSPGNKGKLQVLEKKLRELQDDISHHLVYLMRHVAEDSPTRRSR